MDATQPTGRGHQALPRQLHFRFIRFGLVVSIVGIARGRLFSTNRRASNLRALFSGVGVRMVLREQQVTYTTSPEDPAVLKTLRDSELLRRSVFTTPPQIYYAMNTSFEGTNVCNSQENRVRTPCAAIVNHYAIVNLLRRANLLRRSIFSTAGSTKHLQDCGFVGVVPGL